MPRSAAMRTAADGIDRVTKNSAPRDKNQEACTFKCSGASPGQYLNSQVQRTVIFVAKGISYQGPKVQRTVINLFIG